MHGARRIKISYKLREMVQSWHTCLCTPDGYTTICIKRT